VIDFLVLLIPNIVIGLGGGGRLGAYIATAILQFVYVSVMLATRGQTVGNMAVGTRVVDAQTGAPLTGGRAVGRAAAQLLFNALSIIIIPGLLDILWPLWDRDNQTLHDKMAGTVVIRTP
jgi:uncharacterized RDD family membrane protein YckC